MLVNKHTQGSNTNNKTSINKVAQYKLTKADGTQPCVATANSNQQLSLHATAKQQNSKTTKQQNNNTATHGSTTLMSNSPTNQQKARKQQEQQHEHQM